MGHLLIRCITDCNQHEHVYYYTYRTLMRGEGEMM